MNENKMKMKTRGVKVRLTLINSLQTNIGFHLCSLKVSLWKYRPNSKTDFDMTGNYFYEVAFDFFLRDINLKFESNIK